MRYKLTAVAVAALALSACAPKGPDVAADTAAITKVRTDYEAAIKAMNADAVGALFAADGQSMENGQPSATGPSGVQTMMMGLFETMSGTELAITSEKLEISGDLAYDRGTYTFTLTPKGAPAPMTETGRYLVALKRQADGSWKIAETMGNSPTAPVAAPAAK